MLREIIPQLLNQKDVRQLGYGLVFGVLNLHDENHTQVSKSSSPKSWDVSVQPQPPKLLIFMCIAMCASTSVSGASRRGLDLSTVDGCVT